jgi:hypothetical protein
LLRLSQNCSFVLFHGRCLLARGFLVHISWRTGTRSVSPLHSFAPKHQWLGSQERAGHALKIFVDPRQSRQTGRTPQSAQEETLTS